MLHSSSYYLANSTSCVKGVVSREKGDWATAQKLFEESLETRKTIGDKIGVASCYGNLGAVAYQNFFLFFDF